MDYDEVMGLEITLKVGCPNNCDYCPQGILQSRYRGPREFTLESFRRCIEQGQVPVRRNLTFMGAGEPLLCRDAVPIIRWATLERGHQGSLSTTLRGATREMVDGLTGMPFTDTIIHVPDALGEMHFNPDDAWCDVFEYAIGRWRRHRHFVISVYGPPHPRVAPIWERSGVPFVNFGLHDRSGLVPQGATHQHLQPSTRPVPVPLCGKMFCGHLFPNGELYRCCSDYALENCWGNLNETTYLDCYRGQAFRDYMQSLTDPSADPRCRHCNDGYHSINPEDRGKTYENPCPRDGEE